MNGFIVDTNVISEFEKPTPDRNVMRWFRQADPKSLFISVLTLGEIRLGIENMAAGKRRTDLEQWLEAGRPDWFALNLLPVQSDCRAMGHGDYSGQA